MNLPREVENIDIENIYIGPRVRSSIDPERVEALAASIKAIGLHTPVTVRFVPEMMIDGVVTVDVPVLVAGCHRLEALKLLGIDRVPCIDIGTDEIEAQLWEIAENLHRAELTALERDEHIAKWIELSNGRKVSHVVTPLGGKQPSSKGVRAAEAELGINRMDASRALKVAALSDDAKEAAREAGLDDNRTALLDAAKAEPQQQAALIRTMAEKRKVDKNRLDGDLATRAAKEFAEMMADRFAPDTWDAAKALLAIIRKPADIMVEFNNITGQSIMDKRFG